MDSDLPSISVVLTAYERRPHLHFAIESVLNQTVDRSKYELIIVKTFRDSYIESLMSPNIKVIDVQKGVKNLLKFGIKAARGEFISFLDDDDAFNRDKLSEVLNLFDHFPNLGYIHNSREIIDESGVCSINSRYNRDVRRDLYFNRKEKPFSIYKIIGANGVANLSSISVKKSIAQDIEMTPDDWFGLTDYFFFYASVCSENDILISKNRLTQQRIYYSSNSKPDSYSDFVRHLDKLRKSTRLILENFHTCSYSQFIENDLIYWTVKHAISSSKKVNISDFARLFSFFLNHPYKWFLSFAPIVIFYISTGISLYRIFFKKSLLL